jgi:radical SAM superfamily enzyme YgiQ (UPF0313 family)
MWNLIFYYPKNNKYGLRALLFGLERNNFLRKNIKVYFAYNLHHLKEIISSISSKKIICFSFFSTQKGKIKEIVYSLKGIKNLIKIVGGPFATFSPNQAIDYGFDYVFLGEGEETFENFLERLLRYDSLDTLKGIYFKNKKTIDKSSPVDINKYLPISTFWRRFGPIEITRGCLYQCKFVLLPLYFLIK